MSGASSEAVVQGIKISTIEGARVLPVIVVTQACRSTAS